MIYKRVDFYDFFKENQDHEVFKLLKHLKKTGFPFEDEDKGPLIAGGSLLSLVSRTPFNDTQDIDIFVDEDHIQSVNTYFMKMNAKLYDYENDELPFKSVVINRKLYSFKILYNDKEYTFQIIKIDYVSKEAVLDSFDLNIVRLGFDGSSLFYYYDILNQIESKTFEPSLVSEKYKIYRIIKYLNLGYEIDTTTAHYILKTLDKDTVRASYKQIFSDYILND